MTNEEIDVVNIIKFEMAKLDIEIIDENGFDFNYRTKNGIGQVYTKNIVARYLLLKSDAQRMDLIKSLINVFLGNDGSSGSNAVMA
jgi:hypothetical protein